MRTTALTLGSLALLAPLFAGCAPADVAGDYTVNTTDGPNECQLAGWTEGETRMGIPVTVRQDDTGAVQLDVMGVVGGLLDLAAGSSVFVGDVNGNDVDAELIGQRSSQMGGCNYTTTIELRATLDGDVLEGELRYRPVTNDHPDCGVLAMCANVQSFNGARPPTE